MGKFDYFSCSGVLHHLENPDLGVKILSDVMKEDAGGSIMVYAQYDRTGVYQMQELLRRTGKGVGNRQEKVISAWDVINSLPQTNWYKKGGDLMGGPFDDHELYDRFLHEQDRAYTIPQLYEFVENAGLNIVNFILPYGRASLNIESYFKDSATKERIKNLPLREQQAICELMGGGIITHEIYISKQKNTVADFSDLENVPFVFNTPNLCQNIIDIIENGGNNIMNKYVIVKMADSNKREMDVTLAILPHTKSLFAHLKTGNKSLFEIFESVRKDTGSKSTDQELWSEFMMNLNPLYSVGSLLLRNKLIKPFNDFLELSE